ncbi:phage tail tape measure protein [Anoxybacillus sp. MB8]|uniref:phage tail tape measure protein n=1 Tax=Anoxybacillus sp. MB8 TaxID=2496850 RepID=UPI0013D36B7F|nr:phage tail tape measure protein [Anoxybacillus sp. MB8]
MSRKQLEMIFHISGKVGSSFRSSFGTAGSQLDRLRDKTSELKSALKELDKHHRNAILSTDQFRVAQSRLSSQLEKVKNAQEQLSQAQRRYQELQRNMADTRMQMLDTAAMATPIVVATKAAMDFEQSMLGVAKQVDGARDHAGNLTKVYYEMREEIFKMGREMGVPNAELAQLMAFSAKMGVPREELVLFTKEVAKLGEAFEMAPEEIGTSMGKLANIFKIPYKEIGKLGDVINYLDDKTLASGRGIIDVMMRAGGQAKDVHLTEKQLAALASTFLSLGKSEEVAGTAAVALMRELALAEEQPERYSKALKKLGLTTKQVTKGMAKDAQGTILDVLDRINKLSPEEKTAVTVGIFGKEYGDDIATLANGIKEYRKQLKLVNDEAAKGSSDREFEARNKTSYAELQKLKNSMNEFAVNVGDTVLPTLNEIFKSMADISRSASEFAKQYPNVTKLVVTSATGLIAARMGWLGLKFVIDSARLSLAGGAKFFSKMKGNAAVFQAQQAMKNTQALITNAQRNKNVISLAERAKAKSSPTSTTTTAKVAKEASKSSNVISLAERAKAKSSPPSSTTTTTKVAKEVSKSSNVISLAERAKANNLSLVSNAPVAARAKSVGKMSKALATTGKVLSKAALPLTVAAEAYSIYKAQDKTKAIVQSGTGIAGSIGGAKLGAAIGTAIAPGIGTAVGGVLGGLVGYAAGRWLGGKGVDAVRNSSTARAHHVANQNNTAYLSKATQEMAMHINRASHNFSLLTQYAGMASGKIAGASFELSNNIKKASNNFSLLTMYTGQACGWMASLNGIQTAGQRVISALNKLEARINNIKLPETRNRRVSYDG